MPTSDQGHIKINCPCGKRVAVPGDWAGRRIRCPKCGQALTVPAAEPDESVDLWAGLADGQTIAVAPLDTATPMPSPSVTGPTKTRLCPSCGEPKPISASICVPCGIDLKSGRSIQMAEDEESISNAYHIAERTISWISWVMAIGIFPIASEAFGLRKPWAVRGLAILTILISAWFMVAYIYTSSPDESAAHWMQWSGRVFSDDELRTYVREELNDEGGGALAELSRAVPGADESLVTAIVEEIRPKSEYHWYQPLTCSFLHGGILHLAGNLLFFMVLGSRVNMLIGNIFTIPAYVFLAFASGWVHGASMADVPMQPSLGASGAVMGLAGMYLVLFPATRVHMAAWIRWGLLTGFTLNLKIFPVRGFWVVLFYIAFDVIYTYFGIEDNVAHWAHLGGFMAGVALALALLVTRLIDARGGDILSVALGRFAWPYVGKPGSKRLALW